MSNIADRSPLGMKWYTFFVDVRPCIGFVFFLLFVFGYGKTFLTLMNINKVGAAFAIPTTIYVVAYIADTIANLVLLSKARNNSGEALFRLIKRILIFEIFYIPYGTVLGQYYEGQSAAISLMVLLTIMTLFYFVWYKLNIKYFRKRLVPWELTNTMPATAPEETKVPEHVEYSLSHENEVPRQSRQYGAWNVTGADISLETSDVNEVTKTPKEPDLPHQEIPVITREVEQRPSYAKYCSKCGNGIDPVTKVCTGCGKQYFKGVPWKTVGVIVALLLLIASVGLNVYMYSKQAEAQKDIAELTKKNNELMASIADLQKTPSTPAGTNPQPYYKELGLTDDQYEVASMVAHDVDAYCEHMATLMDIAADFSYSLNMAKSRVAFNLDYNQTLTDGEKMILYKVVFPSDNVYNSDIVDYLDKRVDIGYWTKRLILLKLGIDDG